MNYRDRNENTILEVTSEDKLLNNIYSTNIGRLLLKVLTHPYISVLLGKILSTKLSGLLIKPFINYAKINMDDYVKQRYSSYNDFFTRHIKSGKRPINLEKNILISPCDGKMLAYRIDSDSTFSIKNAKYNVHTLLRDKKLAREFEGGYCLIFRLSVEDYHRFCYIDNLSKTKNRRIKGVLHTLNPVAYDYFKIYKENTREYSILYTENFGKVIQIEVGSMFVGKIKNHHGAGSFYKGQEKGMFEFGGSTIILLIQKNKVKIDRDILLNTRQRFETVVKLGEKIGSSC